MFPPERKKYVMVVTGKVGIIRNDHDVVVMSILTSSSKSNGGIDFVNHIGIRPYSKIIKKMLEVVSGTTMEKIMDMCVVFWEQ